MQNKSMGLLNYIFITFCIVFHRIFKLLYVKLYNKRDIGIRIYLKQNICQYIYRLEYEMSLTWIKQYFIIDVSELECTTTEFENKPNIKHIRMNLKILR